MAKTVILILEITEFGLFSTLHFPIKNYQIIAENSNSQNMKHLIFHLTNLEISDETMGPINLRPALAAKLRSILLLHEMNFFRTFFDLTIKKTSSFLKIPQCRFIKRL